MKRRPMKPGTAAAILVLIYLVGLVIGLWVVCYLLGSSKRPGLAFVTGQMVEQYTTTGQVDPSPISGRSAIVYDPNGTVLAHFQTSGRPIYFDLEAQGLRYLPQALAGRQVLKLILFAKDDTTLGYTSLVYFGMPLEENGAVAGALFWVRELQDLLETLLAFVCTFTAVLALISVFMLQNLSTQRRYDQLRRHYIDNITHELKTPVASIKALAEALSDGMEKDSADRSVYYGMIIREANRQERMICDVLELSKLQSVQVKMEKTTVSANELLSPTLDKYAFDCELMDITLRVDESVKVLPKLYTDPVRIRTVLDVLLSNAVKFVPEAGCITVSARLAHRCAVICVSDNGKGISKEELPHVFERFYKGHRSDNESGSGLGLAIAKEIMDNLKERIWLESEAGQGTTAYFTISVK